MPCAAILFFTMGFASGWVGTALEEIEKQFHLPSTISATLATASDLGNSCSVAFISYIGSKFNKAKGLSLGMFLFGVGLTLNSLPHYLLEPYTAPSHAVNRTHEPPTTCPTNSSSSANNSAVQASEGQGGMGYFSMLLAGQVLSGIGSTTFYTLGIAYIDNNAPVAKSAIFIGVINTVTTVGAAMSALVGGRMILYMYVDFDRVDTDSLPFGPGDQRWIGAWWFGFIVCGVITMVVCLVISGYPKRFPNSPKRKELESEKKDEDPQNLFQFLKKTITDFLKALFKLIFDLEFVFISIGSSIEGVAIAGMSMFIFKFASHEFDMDYETAGYIIGVKAIVASSGYLLAGYLIKRLKLDLLGMERVTTGLYLIVLVFGLSMFAACPDVRMIGLDLPYPGDSDVSGFLASCQGQCQCQGQDFSPVCSSDGLVYFSPCHAGCLDSSMDGDVMTFTNCSCIAAGLNTSVTDALATATAGKCSTDCWQVYLVMPCLFVMYIAIYLCATLTALSTLRCVDPDIQPFALGIKMIFVRVIGTIPAPLVVGVVVDSACELWSGAEGAQFCQLYDKQALAVGIAVMWLSVGLIACIFMFLASLVNLWKKKRRAERKSAEMNDAGSPDEKHNGDAKSGVQESPPE
ncbi:solute carrier organic anion transporter family member 4A1-like [Haliotis rufescens]|uniref:solute carrier organic anion transporter family member 4A1-like n=1 Tax=Haliotis rufescens TaxID=6454 RepID=UPI00201EEE84|nr:solute carrier organic anion transporter family member 4A1-like [Haliotis rufescens]